MHIHTVQKGETVFSIAERYGVYPSKIIENNGISNPRRLCVGQELLILTPTRTYTVKDGDTLSGIAMRFDTTRRDILRANPSHTKSERLVSGEVLAVKCGAERYGCAASNGYFYQGCSKEKLLSVMPYLTYLTVASTVKDKDGFHSVFNEKDTVRLAREQAKIPLLRIYDTSDGGCYFDKSCREALTDEMIEIAKRGGFSGIVLSAFRAYEASPQGFGEFIVDLRKKLIGSDLIIFTEVDELTSPLCSEFADGAVFTYDKLALSEAPSFKDGERRALTDFAERSESSKTFVDIPALAYSDGRYMSVGEAIASASSSGAEISSDKDSLVSSFSLGSSAVRFESMENIKAKLGLVSELGYMGISFDIMRTPISTLMMYDSLFKTFCGL